MSSSSPPDSKENVGLAFALVFGAGLSTALGASVVFVPRWVAYAQQSTLAAGLGLSAGVMVYVSFVEIVQKSRTAFVQAGYEEAPAYAYATLCFFGGVAIMELLNACVSFFLHRRPSHSPGVVETTPGPNSDGGDAAITTGGCCANTVHDWEVLRQMAASLARDEEERSSNNSEYAEDDVVVVQDCCGGHRSSPNHPDCGNEFSSRDDELPLEDLLLPPQEPMDDEDPIAQEDTEEDDTPSPSNLRNEEDDDEEKNQQLLLRMSLNTAVAIGLHNFPEGLATFVATLHDPTVGAVLAVAIAIHNIPEGLCVALPIYYATGSRRKALLGALLSGLSEPLAAVLGYIVLAQTVSYTTYAILFGVVAGMMVMISTRELLPTAHRYDPNDRVVTYAFIFGMAVMALSLVLFVI